MKATFTYAARYQITAICQTPLRTGGSDGDRSAVLRDGQNRAFLQGTSVAGAFRAWLEEHTSPELTERLLGSQKMTGHLIVSDALFNLDAEQYTRPRLRINPATGDVKRKDDKGKPDNGKFDMAHIGAGACLIFSLTWLGDREHLEELDTVEQLLAALHSGDIRLGAQKSNGFGRVALTVTKRLFDMTDPEARQAWLDDADDGTALELPEVMDTRRVTFTVTGQADSILIRAASNQQTDSGSYTPNLFEGGRPILPGSSVKGAVRARAESIAKAVNLDEVWLQELFGRNADKTDNGKPGRVWFEDVRLDDNKRKITRIRINKLTGGVVRGGLFKEEPVSSAVKLTVSAPNEPLACALLLYALRDLGMGLYNLGSGGSIGRGYVTVHAIEAAAPDGRRAMLAFDGLLACSLDDPDGLAAEWLEAWGGAVREN